MREMKDSGIEWIGEIPATWDIHPVYSYFGERKNINSLGNENNLLSLSYGRVIRKDINANGGLLPESFNTYNIVEADDIIIRPTDLQNDKRSLRTGLVKEHGIITSAYIDLCPIKHVDSRYFHYLLHAYDVMKVFYNMGNGVRQGLNYSEFSKLMVFEPSYAEQVSIADFLDAKCAEIDALTVDIQMQIDTLEQYKRSVITEAVTKGLNPDAETKNSGIEWIGEIPSTWNIIRGKYLLEYLQKSVKEDDGVITCFRDGEVTLRSNRREDGFTMSDKEIGYQGIDAGDLVLVALHKLDHLITRTVSKHRKCRIDIDLMRRRHLIQEDLKRFKIRKRFAAGEYKIAFRRNPIHHTDALADLLETETFHIFIFFLIYAKRAVILAVIRNEYCYRRSALTGFIWITHIVYLSSNRTLFIHELNLFYT